MEAETNKSSFLDVAKVTGSASAITVAISLAHETGYFYVVGSKFITFYSIEDYITSSIEWLPAALISFFIGVSIQFILTGLEGGKSHREIANKSQYPRAMYLFRASADWSLIALAVGIALTAASFSNIYTLYAMIFIAIWSISQIYLFKTGYLQSKFSRTQALTFLGAPLLLSLIFGVGALRGEKALSSTDSFDRIIFKNGDVIDNVAVLRNLEKGVLLKNNKYIQYYKSDEIKGIVIGPEIKRPHLPICKIITIPDICTN